MKRSFKKILLLTIALFLFFSASANIKISAQAAPKESYLTADEAVEWLDSCIGKKRGDGQCIAFIKDYYQVLTGYIPSGNACEYSRNRLPEGFGWKRIKGEKNLKKGDILIWTHGTGGNGHAAIYGGDGRYFHQKWTGKYVEVISKAYLGGFSIRRSGSFARYWGVIRPNFRSESMFEEMNSCNYRIKSLSNGKYLTAKNSTELSVKSLVSKKSKQQLFEIKEEKTGYSISPLSTANVVGCVFEEGKTRSGAVSKLTGKSKDDSQRWRFDKVSDAYVIRNVYNPTLCLTLKSGGKFVAETYKGKKSQKWKLETVSTVLYDANGGWNNPAKATVEGEETYEVSSKTPDRIGYKFLGWAKKKNATKATYLSGESFNTDKNITLYAVWKKNRKYEIDSAKLSKSTYTYDGETKTPTVKVKDTNGNTLREGTDYTLSYAKSRKNVGKYKVTVKYKGKFSGKDKLWFTIIPKATEITRLICDGDRVTVKFKKQAEKATGYAVQYSTCSAFSKSKTETVFIDSIKKTAAAIKNLAPDTKWYIRVCSVNESGDKTIRSKWSPVQSVTTGNA